MDRGTSHGSNENYDRRMRNRQRKHDPIDVKKNKCKPWLKKMWCIGKITSDYRSRMYDILDLYAETYDPKRPVVCIDEKSKQLLGDPRGPLPMKPGVVKREDYHYARNGVRNLFVAVEPKAGKRIVSVTQHRKKPDFARFVRDMIRKHYRAIEKVRIVCDNLNTHFEKSFTETFPRAETERIFSKIEFHYTPAHASWLDMAEIEIGILDRQCLNRRMGNEDVLKREVAAWADTRNLAQKTIEWKFTKQDADEKLGSHYV